VKKIWKRRMIDVICTNEHELGMSIWVIDYSDQLMIWELFRDLFDPDCPPLITVEVGLN
jgi:hypothetical protein